MSEVDDLLTSLFESANRTLYADFEQWVRGSKRFRIFIATYKTKIRAKLRNLRDAEGMKDLRTEIETAVTLLGEARFTLEYEKYAALKQRGPDFTVTFKTHTPFNVEVRRMHSVELAEGDSTVRTAKLVAVICDKVGQMPPNIPNFLWLAAETEITEAELTAATVAIRQLAEGKVDPFFAYHGYASAADFLKQYQRLSAVVLRQVGGSLIWQNPLARQKPPPDIFLALQRLLDAQSPH